MAGSINFSADNVAKLTNADTLLKANKRNLLVSSVGMFAGYVGGLLAVDREAHIGIRAVQGFSIGVGLTYSSMEISERYFTVAAHARCAQERGTQVKLTPIAYDLPTTANMAKNFGKYAAAVGGISLLMRAGQEAYELARNGDLIERFRDETAEVVAESVDVAGDAVEEI